jgi:hypothetical protein
MLGSGGVCGAWPKGMFGGLSGIDGGSEAGRSCGYWEYCAKAALAQNSGALKQTIAAKSQIAQPRLTCRNAATFDSRGQSDGHRRAAVVGERRPGLRMPFDVFKP